VPARGERAGAGQAAESAADHADGFGWFHSFVYCVEIQEVFELRIVPRT
jgi:hypothetical protein